MNDIVEFNLNVPLSLKKVNEKKINKYNIHHGYAQSKAIITSFI